MQVLKQSIAKVKAALAAQILTGEEYLALRDAEIAGDNRKSLVTWLEARAVPPPPAEETAPDPAPESASEPESAPEPALDPPVIPTIPPAMEPGRHLLETLDSGTQTLSAAITLLTQRQERWRRSIGCGREELLLTTTGLKISLK